LWNRAQDEKLFPKAEIPLNIFFPLFVFLTKNADFAPMSKKRDGIPGIVIVWEEMSSLLQPGRTKPAARQHHKPPRREL
jgi:hypothetical protein